MSVPSSPITMTALMSRSTMARMIWETGVRALTQYGCLVMSSLASMLVLPGRGVRCVHAPVVSMLIPPDPRILI